MMFMPDVISCKVMYSAHLLCSRVTTALRNPTSFPISRLSFCYTTHCIIIHHQSLPHAGYYDIHHPPFHYITQEPQSPDHLTSPPADVHFTERKIKPEYWSFGCQVNFFITMPWWYSSPNHSGVMPMPMLVICLHT